MARHGGACGRSDVGLRIRCVRISLFLFSLVKIVTVCTAFRSCSSYGEFRSYPRRCRHDSDSYRKNHVPTAPQSLWLDGDNNNEKYSEIDTDNDNDNDATTTTTTTSPTGGGPGESSIPRPSRRPQPRTGWGHRILDWALQSPLWTHVLVPQARATMIRTAEANGIPWMYYRQWIEERTQTVHTTNPNFEEVDVDDKGVEIPDYYRRPFHAYAEGNLCWEAAFEAELASRAVGARNFPAYGADGEEAFRSSFEEIYRKHLDTLPTATITPTTMTMTMTTTTTTTTTTAGDSTTLAVDFGCGTGASTRRLATLLPSSRIDRVLGLDLSPYMVTVGRRLLELSSLSSSSSSSIASDRPDDVDAHATPLHWPTPIVADPRVEFRQADVAGLPGCTGLADGSVDVVHVGFVLHELPLDASVRLLREAHRILRPDGGQLWIGEMDFESPAYAAQRSNPLLFALLRATEPYLDDYADGFRDTLLTQLRSQFATVVLEAATGRHYALVATRRDADTHPADHDHDHHHCFRDERFHEDGSYRLDDTHLKVWESQQRTEQAEPTLDA